MQINKWQEMIPFLFSWIKPSPLQGSKTHRIHPSPVRNPIWNKTLLCKYHTTTPGGDMVCMQLIHTHKHNLLYDNLAALCTDNGEETKKASIADWRRSFAATCCYTAGYIDSSRWAIIFSEGLNQKSKSKGDSFDQKLLERSFSLRHQIFSVSVEGADAWI